MHKNLLLSLALGQLVYIVDMKLFKSRDEHKVSTYSSVVQFDANKLPCNKNTSLFIPLLVVCHMASVRFRSTRENS